MSVRPRAHNRNGVNSVTTGSIYQGVSDPLTNGGDSSTESKFGGFGKLPTVVVPRIDISPYIKPGKGSLGTSDLKSNGILQNKGNNFDKFSMKCAVQVVRDDLEKLKEAVKSGTLMDETMVNCKICNKEYPNEKKLQNHQVNKHMIIYEPEPTKSKKRVSFSDKVIIHEVREYHRCRKCPKIFENYKSLKAHMKCWHKKRKCYICDYCNKKFVDRMFFKVHIKLHCDICGLLLPNKKKVHKHKQTVCRILKHYTCKDCDANFFKFMDLKDHSYDHLDVCYVCDVCKDQCPTKCAMAHHIQFLHTKKRPTSLYTIRNIGTERLYLCNFCDESSVDKDLIESHQEYLPDLKNRVMTGYKDYYFCDQCFKKFKTETEMLQHKWTHFLKTDSPMLRGILNNGQKEPKPKTFRIGDKIPEHMQPKVVLEKINLGGKVLTETVPFVDVNSFDVHNGEIKKPVVDPKSKKTILSKHRCEICGNYYSTNYCLNRHIETQHGDYENLRCKVCEETFVWPSLLRNHRCIRMKIPEMPFEDARPEIHFDNLQEFTSNGFDDLNIIENDDYMNSVDFEIPAPIVELHENVVSSSVVSDHRPGYVAPLVGYKLVVQEVPIEF